MGCISVEESSLHIARFYINRCDRNVNFEFCTVKSLLGLGPRLSCNTGTAAPNENLGSVSVGGVIDAQVSVRACYSPQVPRRTSDTQFHCVTP
jgi:hypothetical protein